ncbi:MAG: T9SS type A sorting domain-containing protein [Bacteroidia bacterium]
MKKLFLLFSLLVFHFSLIKAQTVSTLAGDTIAGDSNGTGAAARFFHPTGVATDNNGNLYVADYGNDKIRKIVISTGVVTTLAGSGTQGSTNGIGTIANFYQPYGVATDGNGNLYIADTYNNEIRKIVISSAEVSTVAGTSNPGSINGTGTAASFALPTGIVTDGINLYVAEWGNNDIRKIVISNYAVTTLVGSTIQGAANGTGTSASFYYPSELALDGRGNLYVSDAYNSEIRQIIIDSAIVTTLAGSTTIGSTDGTGTTASFKYPEGIAFDGNGNLYVADSQNDELRKIVISTTEVTTLAGSTTPGSTNGTCTTASFHAPFGLTLDSSGNLYVADVANNEIRMITGIPTSISTLASNSASISVYPNPNNGAFQLRIKNYESGIRNVEIYNLLGEKVYSQFSTFNSQFSIDISSRPAGMYFIRLESSDGNVATKKFVKE